MIRFRLEGKAEVVKTFSPNIQNLANGRDEFSGHFDPYNKLVPFLTYSPDSLYWPEYEVNHYTRSTYFADESGKETLLGTDVAQRMIVECKFAITNHTAEPFTVTDFPELVRIFEDENGVTYLDSNIYTNAEGTRDFPYTPVSIDNSDNPDSKDYKEYLKITVEPYGTVEIYADYIVDSDLYDTTYLRFNGFEGEMYYKIAGAQ